jgi:hypothetical protein
MADLRMAPPGRIFMLEEQAAGGRKLPALRGREGVSPPKGVKARGLV